MVVGIEPVAQQIGRGLRDQETYLRARRAAEGAAQQIGDEARGALCGLERDVTRKAVAHDHVDLAARQPVALDEAGEIERQMIRIAQHRGGIADRDRKSVVMGKRVSVRLGLGGRRILNKKKQYKYAM